MTNKVPLAPIGMTSALSTFLPTIPSDDREQFAALARQCWDPRTGEAGLRSLWATLAPEGWAFADTTTEASLDDLWHGAPSGTWQ